MNTQRPDKPDKSQDIAFPLTFFWELVYPAPLARKVRGYYCVENPLAYEYVNKIFVAEEVRLKAKRAPLIELPFGKVRFCPEHGACNSAFCMDCGVNTELQELEMITDFAEAVRFCPGPDHAEYVCADHLFFCGHCGQPTMLKGIVNAK
ncbi:MAG: hypothetical protein WCW31_03290 [Patescibacteria group bacterium]|jgi:hypothetical protein